MLQGRATSQGNMGLVRLFAANWFTWTANYSGPSFGARRLFGRDQAYAHHGFIWAAVVIRCPLRPEAAAVPEVPAK